MSTRHWIMEYILRDAAFLVSQSLSFTGLHMAYWVPKALTSNQGMKIKQGMIYHLNGTQLKHTKGLREGYYTVWKWAAVLIQNTTVIHFHFFGLMRYLKPWDYAFLKQTLLKLTDPQSGTRGESLLLQPEMEMSLCVDLNQRSKMENQRTVRMNIFGYLSC